MKKFRLYLAVFVIGFIGVSLWAFVIIVRPPKIILDRAPDTFNLPAENITIMTADETPLAGWFIPSPSEKRRAVVLLHGYPAEKADMLFTAASLFPDMALLLLDLRYFGESGGEYTTLGITERRDVQRALDFLERRGYERIGIFGFSLGGAIGILTAAEDPRVDAVVSYASFSDLRTLGRESYSNLWLLKYPLVELLLLYANAVFNESPVAVSPQNAAHELEIPVFLVHTQQDEQIAFSHAERLQKALSENPLTESYFPEQGLHGELPLDFESRVKNFFLRTL